MSKHSFSWRKLCVKTLYYRAQILTNRSWFRRIHQELDWEQSYYRVTRKICYLYSTSAESCFLENLNILPWRKNVCGLSGHLTHWNTLLGRTFVLETDHRALQWLGKMKDSMPELLHGIWVSNHFLLRSSIGPETTIRLWTYFIAFLRNTRTWGGGNVMEEAPSHKWKTKENTE